MIAVRNFDNAADMIAAARARRAVFYPQRRLVALPAPPVPAVAPPEPPPAIADLPRLPLPVDRFVQSCLELAPDGAMNRARWLVIVRMVVDATGVSFDEMRGISRIAPIVRARMIACYLLRSQTWLSQPQIGVRLGGKDHTTVLHACRKVAADMDREIGLRDLIENLTAQIVKRLGPLGPRP